MFFPLGDQADGRALAQAWQPRLPWLYHRFFVVDLGPQKDGAWVQVFSLRTHDVAEDDDVVGLAVELILQSRAAGVEAACLRRPE